MRPQETYISVSGPEPVRCCLATMAGVLASLSVRTLRSARQSKVSGQPIRERLHELGNASAIRFLEPRLVYRRLMIFCGRPHGPLNAANHGDAANVVPCRAILECPQSDVVYPHGQRAALRRYAARQGLGKLTG